MLITILSRFYRRIAAATRRLIRLLSACYQARRWRRETLRAMRQRSRE